MHARLTSGSIQSDKIDETTSVYQNSIVPVISAQPGFKGVYLLVDRASGTFHSLTLWDSEADGLAYERSGAYQAQVEKVRSYFAAPPALNTFEVAAQALAPARVIG